MHDLNIIKSECHRVINGITSQRDAVNI